MMELAASLIKRLNLERVCFVLGRHLEALNKILSSACFFKLSFPYNHYCTVSVLASF
jgi:hypothetical protein